jgi:hypothetical protein
MTHAYQVINQLVHPEREVRANRDHIRATNITMSKCVGPTESRRMSA